MRFFHWFAWNRSRHHNRVDTTESRKSDQTAMPLKDTLAKLGELLVRSFQD
jgi:hypothetical protein